MRETDGQTSLFLLESAFDGELNILEYGIIYDNHGFFYRSGQIWLKNQTRLFEMKFSIQIWHLEK